MRQFTVWLSARSRSCARLLATTLTVAGMLLGPGHSTPMAQTVSDSDFVYVVPDSIAVSDSVTTHFSMTLVLNNHTAAQALTIPLSFAGLNEKLKIDKTINDGFSDLGITQKALGNNGTWTIRSSLIDSANQRILIGYVSFGAGLPPSNDSLVAVHFTLPPGGGPAVHVFDTAFFPPANELTLTDPAAVERYMQWQPAIIAIASDSIPPDTIPPDTTVTDPQICPVPDSLSFTAHWLAPLPPAQSVVIANCGTGEFDWAISSTSPDWLSASPTSGVGGDTVEVTATNTYLPPGTHQAALVITSASAVNSPQYVQVSYTMLDMMPRLCVSPPALTFGAKSGGALPPSQEISVINCGSPGMNWYAYTLADWLTLVGSPAWTMDSGWVTVQPSRTDLPPGTYETDIKIIATNGENSPQFVHVYYAVSGATSDSDHVYLVPSVIHVPDSVSTDFALSVMLDTHTPAQGITIPLSYGGPGAGLRIDTTYVDVVGNLGVTQSVLAAESLWTIRTSLIDPIARTILLGYISFGDALPPSHDTLVTVHFTFEPGGGTGVQVIDTTAVPPANHLFINDELAREITPRWTPAAVFIGDSIPAPLLCLSATDLNFQADQNDPLPPAQYLGIFNCGDGHLDWSIGVDVPWLSVTPLAAQSDSSYVTVAVNTTALAPVAYHGTITVTDPQASNSPQIVSVDYTVYSVDSSGNDSDFFWIEPQTVVLDSDLDTTFSVTVMINTHTPAAAIALPLTWAGPNANLQIDTTVLDGFGNRGITQGPLGEDTLTWSIRSTLIDDDNRRILIGYVSFGDPLPPSSGALVTPHFHLAAGGAQGLQVLDTTTIVGNPFTLVDPNAVDYVPNWTPGFISIERAAQPQLCLSTDSLVFYAVVNDALPPDQPFAVMNCGDGTLTWSVEEDIPWLSVSPDYGSDSALIDVDITTTAMAPGSYSGILLIVGPGIQRDTVHVLYTVADAPPTASDFIYLTPSLITLPTGVDTSFDITIMLHTDRYYLSAVDIPLTFAGSGPKVTIDTTVSDGLGNVGVTQQRLGSDTAWESIHVEVDNVEQTIKLIYIDFDGMSIGNVDDSLVTMHFKLSASPDPVQVKIDTTTILPGNGLTFLDENATDIPVGWTGGTITSGTTGRDSTFSRPDAYALNQNYPNPFNAGTRVQFKLFRAGFVELKVFNVLGMPVRTLVAQDLPAGIQTVNWDGNDDRGRPVASGTYFYRLRVGADFEETRGMTLLR